MSFVIHPVLLIAGIGLLVALVLVLFACRARSGFVIGLLIFFALVFTVPAIFLCLVLHPEVIDGRYRTYKAFYGTLRLE